MVQQVRGDRPWIRKVVSRAFESLDGSVKGYRCGRCRLQSYSWHVQWSRIRLRDSPCHAGYMLPIQHHRTARRVTRKVQHGHIPVFIEEISVWPPRSEDNMGRVIA